MSCEEHTRTRIRTTEEKNGDAPHAVSSYRNRIAVCNSTVLSMISSVPGRVRTWKRRGLQTLRFYGIVSYRTAIDASEYDARSTCQGLHTVQGLLATGLRPSPTCPRPSKRDTRMTRASATAMLLYHFCRNLRFASTTPPNTEKRGERDTKTCREGHKTKQDAQGNMKCRRRCTGNLTRYICHDGKHRTQTRRAYIARFYAGRGRGGRSRG
jgi:hypothetical protein